MENTLQIFHRILFLDLRPCECRNRVQDYFKSQAAGMDTNRYTLQPLWETSFLPPYTPKLKYYHKLIVNEAAGYFNHLSQLIQQAADDEEKWYHTYTALHKVVGEKLKQVADEINRLDYRFGYILPGSSYRQQNALHAEESWIFQLLKVQLIALYLNIHEAFGKFSKEGKPDEKEVYYSFFSEEKPEPGYLKKAETIVPPITPVPEKDIKRFVPVRDNLVTRGMTKVDYSFVRSPDRFAEIETRLYEYEIINAEYHIIPNKKQSNHTLLAAVYREMIDKNYFRRNILKSKEKVKDIDIRKFLDVRYATDTSQQFRKLKPEQVEFARNKLPWLEKIVRIP